MDFFKYRSTQTLQFLAVTSLGKGTFMEFLLHEMHVITLNSDPDIHKVTGTSSIYKTF